MTKASDEQDTQDARATETVTTVAAILAAGMLANGHPAATVIADAVPLAKQIIASATATP
jgi:hypothetical protein